MRIILIFNEARIPMRNQSKTIAFTLIFTSLFSFSSLLSMFAVANAAEPPRPVLRMTNGHFEPAKLIVPSGHPVQLKILNQDHNAIEFESFDLHREQVVAPGATITVYLPALAPGNYSFFDDFHGGIAHGIIVSH